MATIIEELVVRLGLDSKDLVNKSSDAKKKLDDLDRGAQSTEKSFKGAASGLGEAASKLGAFLALLGGTVALKAFILDAINTNTQLAFFAKNIGTSAQAVSAWSIASQELGGTSQGLQSTLKMLSQESSNLAFLGESRLIPFFAKMRIALAGPNGPRDPTAILRDLAKYAQNAMGLGESRASMHNWLAMFIPDEGTINLILQGTKALDAAQARAKKWAPTPQELQTAVDMKSTLADLSARFTKIGYDLLQSASPALEKFFTLLGNVGDWISKHEDLARIFAEATLATAALGAAMAFISSPIALVSAGVTALIAGILSLIDDYKTWAKGGVSEFDWSGFTIWVNDAAEAWDSLGNMIGKATDKYSKWAAQHAPHNNGNILKDLGQDVGRVLGGIFGINSIQADAETIAKREGFYVKGSIPQRANNPGDIEWNGPNSFAAQHGATGFIMAANNQKIAVFPDVDTGWKALYALRKAKGTKPWAYMSPLLTGPSGMPDLLQAMRSLPATSGPATSVPVGASQKTIHIAGDLNIQTHATDALGIFESIQRGTDFLTWGAPANGASQ